MISLLKFSLIFLSITIFLCMYRAIKGPSIADRIIAINVVNTKVITIIIGVSFIFHETYFIDVALVYALISFTASVLISKVIKES
ncbi:MAG: monovalent cation/H+ antiporter complex subunit F [Eubacteriales bacterium]